MNTILTTINALHPKMTGAILQARLHSTRLPMKALRRIGRQTIIEYCIQAMKRIGVDIPIIVTNPQSYGILSKYAARHSVEIVVGPDSDVLSRFGRVVHAYNLKTVVRLTADNPFVSVRHANSALREFTAARCDYFHYVDLPLGAGVEVMSGLALCAAQHQATTAYDREHVTSYIYRNDKQFKVVHARYLGRDYSNMRITVDSEADYQRMITLFADCNTPCPSLRKIIAAYQMRNG